VSAARLLGAFPALAIPNYRRYLTGQSVSLAGTWMQMTAQAWLVLTLSNSPSALGIIVALQTLPVLVLGPYGGVIADRVDKLRLMISLQSVMGVLALVLGLLTVTGEVRLWHVGVLAPSSASTTPSRTPRGSRSCSRWSGARACAPRSA
jgi:MFS family permease